MPAATVTSKGQITIPAPVRIALGVDAGDRVEFVEIEKGRFAIVPAIVPLSRLKGIIRKPDKPVSIDEMNTAIARRRAGQMLKKEMIGLDTNVLVRYLVQDDPEQSAAAESL